MAKYLVIVESPAKVKTIKKFLGKNYEVMASNGHVRDLPKSQLGIDVEHDYEPKYITIRGKGEILAKLRKEAKKAEKEAKKAAEAAEQMALFEQGVQALKEKDFVLEAERVEFKRGQFVYVTPSTNFVSMKGDRATIQLAFNTAAAGPNGIGGITVDGSASNIEMKTDKKGNVTFSMMVQGVAVSANVTIRMVKGTNKCTATVSPNFNSNRISFTGYLYPSDQSNVFKGRAI